MKHGPLKDTASRYRPPDHVIRIAAERTRAIVRAWSAEIVWKPMDFMTLAESCYMQGLNDMADAAVKAGWIPPLGAISSSKNMGDLP